MSIVNVLELPSCAIARRGWIGSDNDWLIEQSRKDGQRLFVALEDFERLRAENERLTKDLEHANKVVHQYVGLWDEAERQITALRRPVEQNAEVEAIRKYCIEWFEEAGAWVIFDTFQVLLSALDATARQLRERVEMLEALRLENNRLVVQEARSIGERMAMEQDIARLSSPPQERAEIRDRNEARKEDTDGWDLVNRSRFAAVSDIDTLLGDCAAWRNAHALVTAQLKTAHETIVGLTPEAVRHADQIAELESINQSKVERLEGALKLARKYAGCDSECGSSEYQNGQRVSCGCGFAAALPTIIAAATNSEIVTREDGRRTYLPLAASQQHTAGSGDGVAGD